MEPTYLRFTPGLADWIRLKLQQGEESGKVLLEMHANGMPLEVAKVIWDAFLSARHQGLPLPFDRVAAPSAQAAYVYGASRLGEKSVLTTHDRLIQVLARAEQPCIAVLGNVMSDVECAQLIEMARPRLAASTLVDPTTGHDTISEKRQSYGMFFKLRENELVARLDQRLSEIMRQPVGHGEGIQILYYPEGALSAPHQDYLLGSNPANRASIERSGQRISTLVTYLNRVEAGGETEFPLAGWRVTPAQGNAVYFEYSNSLHQLDHASLHSSRAVQQGEKWVATKWMRERKFVSL